MKNKELENILERLEQIEDMSDDISIIAYHLRKDIIKELRNNTIKLNEIENGKNKD